MKESIKAGATGWNSPVQEPLKLDDPDSITWDDAADFVVAGYGGAGMAAALQAAEDGLSVIATDLDAGGGATAMNGGIFYAGAGTGIQREAGIEDDAEQMYRYLAQETQGVVGEATLRRFCENSPAMIDWLIHHGVQFDSTAYLEKTSYPYSTYFLYHSDNSLVSTYAAHARPAARGHKVYSPPSKKATGFGANLTEPLRASAERHGVRFLPQTEVRRLVCGPDGRVIGIEALHMPVADPATRRCARFAARANALQALLPPAFPGFRITNALARHYWKKLARLRARHQVTYRVRARRGVCLSTGGFVYNRKMIHQYAPDYDAAMPLGHPSGDNGSGIRLGQSVGGSVDRLERISAWRFINPPKAFAHGMLVNARGARYCNETLYGASIGHYMCEEQGGAGYLILDRNLYRKAWRQARHDRMLPFQSQPAMLALLFGRRKAKTLNGLAKRCGFDPDTLRTAVDQYNRTAQGGGPDPFGKEAKDMDPLTEGPWYAVDMSRTSTFFPLPTMTVGGLRVEEETGLVRDENNATIPGLYAAGRTAIGICSNIYVSGLSAADCIFSGRRAAGHVATNAETGAQGSRLTRPRQTGEA